MGCRLMRVIMRDIGMYALGVLLMGSTITLHVYALHHWWRVSRSHRRVGRLNVVPGHRGLSQPLHPFTIDDPRFEDAW